MLSYRHAFHAGNHADVLKHWVLSLVVGSLAQKDKPFFYLDTHAGAGRYALSSAMANQNREFETGIAKLWLAQDVPAVLEPYLAAVRCTNPGRALRWYPGSPRVVRPSLRASDRMVLCELHPRDSRSLMAEFAGDRQVKLRTEDGYQALKALLPPPERRGLVLIDPSFELKDERRRLLAALSEAYRRWSTGIFAVWYPIQDRASATGFLRQFQRLGCGRVLLAELMVRAEEPFRLNGSAMLVINPPWQLDERLRSALPWLAAQLGVDGEGRWRVEWLAPPS